MRASPIDGIAPGEPPNQARARHTCKGYGLVCKQSRSDVHVIYTLIAANQAELPIAAMCQHLKVSKSGYYDWQGRAPSKRSLANTTLLAHIEAAHAKSDATYGMPRIRAELADQGIVASRKRIATVMRRAHIRGGSRRRGYVVTTTRDKRQRPAPDLVKRQFVATHTEARLAIFTWLEAWYNPRRRHSSLGQISPINFERQNVQKKKDTQTKKPAAPVDNSAHAQTELSIDCDRQINLIENTQKIMNL